MARASDARRAAGEAGPLEGAPLGIKDLFCTKGVRTTAGSKILGDFKPTYESTVTANLWRDGAVMLGKLNMDEFAMGSSNETSAFGPVVNPWRSRGSQPAADAGRLVGRLGRGGGGGPVPRRHGHRHRRLDPPAGLLHRHGRHQADLWPLLALGHRRLRLVAGPGRADRPRRSRTRRSCCSSMAGHDPKDSTSLPVEVPDFASFVGKSVKGLRIGVPKEYRVDGMPRRDRGAVGPGHRLAEGRRLRDRRGLACRTPNTPCRPTTSSPRPRPRRTSPATTACATACASTARP